MSESGGRGSQGELCTFSRDQNGIWHEYGEEKRRKSQKLNIQFILCKQFPFLISLHVLMEWLEQSVSMIANILSANMSWLCWIENHKLSKINPTLKQVRFPLNGQTHNRAKPIDTGILSAITIQSFILLFTRLNHMNFHVISCVLFLNKRARERERNPIIN